MSSGSDGESDAVSNMRTPLVFISHDTRDASVAEAFSKLLGSVSAGVLKSFRSSDKRGNQGIEYGVEWYPEIMKKLEAASDVVCLLTHNSVNRPWILYEAGVAKGKLDTPVHGVAIGIPLQSASSGPFAQFQNSDDSEDALTQLVIQLVRRIPGAEPDREVVQTQVDAFRERALVLLSNPDSGTGETEQEDGASVAKLFEEVKVMFQDLPSRIERRFDPDYPIRRRRNISEKFIYEFIHEFGNDLPNDLGLIIIFSQFRNDYPWLYELAFDAYRHLLSGSGEAVDSLQRLDHAFHLTFDHPVMRELGARTKDRFVDRELMMRALHRAISIARNRAVHRSDSPEKVETSWTDERLEKLR